MKKQFSSHTIARCSKGINTSQKQKLYSLGRYEDAKLALDDRQVRLRLYEELCIV